MVNATTTKQHQHCVVRARFTALVHAVFLTKLPSLHSPLYFILTGDKMSAVITSGYGPAILQFLIVNGTLSSSSGKVVYEDPENPNMSWMVTADQKDFYAALESESEGKIARLRRQPNGQLTKQEVINFEFLIVSFELVILFRLFHLWEELLVIWH